jgi:hypothetical protein
MCQWRRAKGPLWQRRKGPGRHWLTAARVPARAWYAAFDGRTNRARRAREKEPRPAAVPCSRRQYLRFAESQDFTTTIREHTRAFEYFQGLATTCLYDNMKVVVTSYDGDHFGEGEYGESERVIQELLKENGATGLGHSIISISASGVEAAPSADMQSPETYLGYRQAERFSSPERQAHDARKTYTPPTNPALNQWGLSGAWDVGAESAVLQAASGKIVFRFHSRDLHMVLGPAEIGKTVCFKVTLNGIGLRF